MVRQRWDKRQQNDVLAGREASARCLPSDQRRQFPASGDNVFAGRHEHMRESGMTGMKPKQTLRFAAVLVALPLYLGGINYCLFSELARLPHCGGDGECTEHQAGAMPSHHAGASGAPKSRHPSGATYPCCISLVGVVVPKPMGPASTHFASSAAVLAETSPTLLPQVSWNGHGIIPTERPSPSLHRSPSAPRAPPLS